MCVLIGSLYNICTDELAHQPEECLLSLVLCFVLCYRHGCISRNIFVWYFEDLLSKVYETSGNVGKENVL